MATTTDSTSSPMQDATPATPIRTKTIGTHNGVFHCDEVLACAMLKQLPEWSTAKIVRSRDMDVLNECDIVVDVGGTYDHAKLRYDHHQRSFTKTFSDVCPEFGPNFNVTYLSSAGLIFAHYGERIITAMLSSIGESLPDQTNKQNVAFIKQMVVKVYEHFIQEIDAIDNGVEMYEGQEPRYRISTHLSARVGLLNPPWNKPDVDETEQFEKALSLVLPELRNKVLYYVCHWWPGRTLVEQGLKSRFNVYNSGEIVRFPERCPWKSHLFQLEKEMNIVGQIKYVLDDHTPGDARVTAVPVSEFSFLNRKALPEQWRGLRDAELAEASGVSDAVFCHGTGFIAGCKTYDGVHQMAVKSLTLW